MPDPNVNTQTAPGGATRTTLTYGDGTVIQITKGSKGTAIKTTTSGGQVSHTFTDNDGNSGFIEGGRGDGGDDDGGN